MRLGKRSKGDEPKDDAPAELASEPPTAIDETSAPYPAPEAIVDSDAVELTGAPPAPEPAARPVPLTVEQIPALEDPPAPAANPIVDVSGAPSATGPSFDGHAPPPPADPLEPVRVLADQRPELVVGAAFAGGVLAAMILRRLGN